jgi:hypothetical protein
MIIYSKMSDILVDKYKTILTDSVVTLANNFKEAGMNPPTKIEVDSSTFQKLLEKQ